MHAGAVAIVRVLNMAAKSMLLWLLLLLLILLLMVGMMVGMLLLLLLKLVLVGVRMALFLEPILRFMLDRNFQNYTRWRY